MILRCLTGLYLIWFKSYDTKCSIRQNAILAKSETLQKYLQLINGRFTTIFGHFFANCMSIFHKTEIQTVIFRCLTSLNLNWYKSYDKKHKNAKNTKDAIVCFCTKLQKKRNGNICVLSHSFCTNQSEDPLSTSKWPSEPQFCEIFFYSWHKNGQKWS